MPYAHLASRGEEGLTMMNAAYGSVCSSLEITSISPLANSENPSKNVKADARRATETRSGATKLETTVGSREVNSEDWWAEHGNENRCVVAYQKTAERCLKIAVR